MRLVSDKRCPDRQVREDEEDEEFTTPQKKSKSKGDFNSIEKRMNGLGLKSGNKDDDEWL